MKIYFKQNSIFIISKTFFKIFKKVFGFSISAFTLFPVIFFKNKDIAENKEYINHELIHIRQYVETLFVGFILIIIFEFLYAKIVLRKNTMQAYYFLAFEQEAHQNDQDKNYLQNRKWFSSFKYMLVKNKRKITQIEGKREFI